MGQDVAGSGVDAVHRMLVFGEAHIFVGVVDEDGRHLGDAADEFQVGFAVLSGGNREGGLGG